MVQGEILWQLLPLKGHWEGVLPGVREGNFSDLDSVVCEKVVHDVRISLEVGKELEHLPIIFQKLLL